MAWVNFASLPSEKGHIYYVAGESQDGNDFDLQFETANNLKFFTASGDSLEFKPPASTLVGQWHMIVATMDAAKKSLSIYWDGKLAATRSASVAPNKTTQFSIGESLVFHGRYFDGSIRDVALWNRVLDAGEVARLYSAASSAPSKMQTAGTAHGQGISTTANVELEDANGPLSLKQEEKIAIMFLAAFQSTKTIAK